MAKSVNSPLTEKESKWVADWLAGKGHSLPRGWIAVNRLRPSEVAKRYKVTQAEVIQASRREIEEKE